MKKAKGLVFNVPDITQLPYFRTINPIRSNPDSLCEDMPLYIRKRTGGDIVKAEKGDLILLSALRDIEIRGFGLSPDRPIDSKYVLDSYEINAIRQAIDAYNDILTQLVDRYNKTEKPHSVGRSL